MELRTLPASSLYTSGVVSVVRISGTGVGTVALAVESARVAIVGTGSGVRAETFALVMAILLVRVQGRRGCKAMNALGVTGAAVAATTERDEVEAARAWRRGAARSRDEQARMVLCYGTWISGWFDELSFVLS